MSVFDRIFTESVSDEAEEMRRGSSSAWLKRTQSGGPRSTPSTAAGKWSYNPVTSDDGQFTKWMPPARMSKYASAGRPITVHQESLEDVSERLDTIGEAIFGEDKDLRLQIKEIKEIIANLKRSDHDFSGIIVLLNKKLAMLKSKRIA